MENYEKVSQWAATVNIEKAFREIEALRLKYSWLRCDESFEFISRMHKELPKILKIIQLQEKQNAAHRFSDANLRGYIKANGLADEVIVDELKRRYNVDI